MPDRAEGTAVQKQAKRVFLYFNKFIGMFHLARYFTRKGLRILCYHGVALEDEHVFRASLFISPQTLRRRLFFLSKQRFPVLDLERALDLLDRGNLPPGATVITIDDGFYGVYRHGLSLLQEFSFPATVYVSTYYSLAARPVFRLCVQYMFWKTKKKELEVEGLGLNQNGVVSLIDEIEKERVSSEIEDYGENSCDDSQRWTLATILASRLGVDYSRIACGRLLTIMTPDEIQALASTGVDVQLHTHRHRFPEDESAATMEIADNKAVLEPLTGKTLRHFCYPSGIWSQKHWPWLTAAGVKSATTCEPGLNFPETPKLALHRFLDRDDLSDIEFESEMSGFGELLRRTRSLWKRVLGS
jgi:peptidoglycan/xylan/chitin deacetylase (PgdA/CDA1 family)